MEPLGDAFTAPVLWYSGGEEVSEPVVPLRVVSSDSGVRLGGTIGVVGGPGGCGGTSTCSTRVGSSTGLADGCTGDRSEFHWEGSVDGGAVGADAVLDYLFNRGAAVERTGETVLDSIAEVML